MSQPYIFLGWRDRSEQLLELVELYFGRVDALEPCARSS
jgi:hypothetical protein